MENPQAIPKHFIDEPAYYTGICELKQEFLSRRYHAYVKIQIFIRLDHATLRHKTDKTN